jgi:hypothetical protein
MKRITPNDSQLEKTDFKHLFCNQTDGTEHPWQMNRRYLPQEILPSYPIWPQQI